MQEEQKITEVARILSDAASSSKACGPIRDLLGAQNLEAAYKVQQHNINERIKKENTKIVGRKIGLTAKSVQAQLGVDQPDFGTLLQSMQVGNAGTIPKEELMQAKAEAEIAFVLKEDLTESNLSHVDLIHKVDYAVAALEIVGSRIENWNIGITDTIADNASASHFVLGDVRKKLSEIDLISCKMNLYKNGEKLSEGVGAACLGSPLNAFQWLADKMIEMGSPLKKGDIVLTGALGPMLAGGQGDHFKAEIEGLGEVEVSFAE